MTKRFYSGERTKSKMGEAARMKRLEIEKGGKLPFTPQERYKRILKQKMQETRAAANSGNKTVFKLPGAAPAQRTMSKRAVQALQQISQRKAIKEEKELRKMVVVQPRTFSDAGRITAKGQAFDLGNNITLKVDMKTGKIKTLTGWTVGKYSAKKKMRTNMIITDALKQHGAYFIQQKRLQMLQEQARLAALQNAEGVNLYGVPNSGLASQMFMDQHFGSADAHGNHVNDPNVNLSGVRANQANVTAWGAMSGNVHGSYAENAWGGMMDNVWGGVNNNIWGGMGGSAWGSHRAWKIFGSGSPGQKNFLKPLGALFVGFLGIGMGKGLGRLRFGGRGERSGASARSAVTARSR